LRSASRHFFIRLPKLRALVLRPRSRPRKVLPRFLRVCRASIQARVTSPVRISVFGLLSAFGASAFGFHPVARRGHTPAERGRLGRSKSGARRLWVVACGARRFCGCACRRAHWDHELPLDNYCVPYIASSNWSD
jgi:hypothetical protein